jgi:hypothetical protein
MTERFGPGTPRTRGHRHIGGVLGQREEKRHYVGAIAAVIAGMASAL